MRQWLVDPKLLCRKHLLGEHVESHMFLGSLKKNHSVQGFVDTGLYDPQQLYTRHEELVNEMTRRGYNHKSPLETIKLPNIKGHVDSKANLIELSRRCEECKKLINKENLNEIKAD